jgi:hypothetical protein
MKIQLTPLAMRLSLLGALVIPAIANASTTNDQKLNTLEAQVNQLQQEVSVLKKQSKTGQTSVQSTNSNDNLTVKTTKKSGMTSKTQSAAASSTNQIQGPTDLPTTGPQYLPVDLDVPGQSFVSSGPYIGIPLEYSGSNLIINSPNVNEDIALLNIRKNIAQRMTALGRVGDSSGSHILLSGIIEGQALDKTGNGTNNTDIDVTTANLDAYILGPTSWTSGLLEFAYDNNIGTETGSFSSNDRTLDSRVYMNKAFVVLGNFQESPFYASFGQMFVPFGVYSTTMVSSPLTKIMARTQERAITVGYKQQAQDSLNLSAYIFHGDSQIGDSNTVNNGGLNAAYSFKMSQVNASVGGGVIGNIADSQGMQFTGNNNNTPPLFGGFGGPTETFTDPTTGLVTQESTGNESLVHRVPAYDLHANIGIGNNIQLLGEYIITSTSFSPADLTFNGDGARPQALQLEGVYNLPWFVKPTSISVGYGMSKEALAIGLPAQRYSLTINRSFWKNTLQSLEFRHDINYAEFNTATGSDVPNLITGTSDSVNMVTLQFDYYF